MSKCCHECGCNVENPFYVMSAVLRDPISNRVAFSNAEVSLCYSDVDKIMPDLHETPEEMANILGYSIDGVTGARGGLLGTVRVSSGVYDRHEQYRFLDRKVGLKKLPKSATDLFANPRWVEKNNEEWRPAKWAQEAVRKSKLD